MGQAIRGIVPSPVYPTNSDMLDNEEKYNVSGTQASPHTRGSYGHGKATRLYWSEAAGCMTTTPKIYIRRENYD